MDPVRAGPAFHTILFDPKNGFKQDAFALPFRPFWCLRMLGCKSYMSFADAQMLMQSNVVEN
eukprot:4315706-Amphidinium_carterae.2